MRFNIIIRSILNYKKRAEISAASGVVIDSKPKREYKENYIKAKSLYIYLKHDLRHRSRRFLHL